MSYEKYYSGGWQSGETGGTPITPEALNHMEQGIADLDSEKAPAGYGLGCEGGELKEVTDFSELDALNRNGWYFIRFAEAFYIDGQYAQFFALDVSGETDQHVHQTIHIIGTNYILHRYCDNGVWSTIEWDNPPMVSGVEYRTTERFMGSPVYTKLIDCGIIANGKQVTTEIRNVIRYGGLFGDLPIPFVSNAGDYAIKVEINSGYVVFGLAGFAENTQAYLQLWYTK